MKKLILALALVTPAHAQPAIVTHAVIKPLAVLPPPEYDHPFRGTVVTTVAEDQAMVRRLCPRTVFPGYALGCAYRFSDQHCHIIIASEAPIKAAGWTTEIVRRHEVAHCNGWPADHRGARQP